MANAPDLSSGTIAFQQAIPILRMFDAAKAREFYVDYLGMTVDFEHRFGDNFPLFMGVSRAGMTLFLSEHHGDGTPGTAVSIEMQGLAAFCAELVAKDYRYAKPSLDSAPWAELTMDLSDPFGNQLRFQEREQQRGQEHHGG